VVFIAIGIYVVDGGIVDILNLYWPDGSVPVSILLFRGILIVVVFEVIEDILIGAILDQVELCLFHVSIERSPDEFPSCILRIGCFGITAVVGTADKDQEDYGEEDLFHGAKIIREVGSWELGVGSFRAERPEGSGERSAGAN
jgi:hypothetical protein